MVGDNLHISRVQIEVNERLAVVTGRGGGERGGRALVGGPGGGGAKVQRGRGPRWGRLPR